MIGTLHSRRARLRRRVDAEPIPENSIGQIAPEDRSCGRTSDVRGATREGINRDVLDSPRKSGESSTETGTRTREERWSWRSLSLTSLSDYKVLRPKKLQFKWTKTFVEMITSMSLSKVWVYFKTGRKGGFLDIKLSCVKRKQDRDLSLMWGAALVKQRNGKEGAQKRTVSFV